jgi:hypothetical protein
MLFVTAPQAYPDALKYLGSRVGGQVSNYSYNWRISLTASQVMCIALPSAGQFNVGIFYFFKVQSNLPQATLVPARLIFRNQSFKGTLVANMADVDETLQFAKRGKKFLKTGRSTSSNRARETATPAYCRWPIQVQRGMSTAEARQSCGAHGRRLQYGVERQSSGFKGRHEISAYRTEHRRR